MTRDLDAPKASPASVARAIFDGVENEEEDIFPDASESMAQGWRAVRPRHSSGGTRRLAAAERIKARANSG